MFIINQLLEGTYNSYKGRAIDPSKKVRIYRNLNNGKVSIKQGGLVIGHADKAFVQDATFIVSEAGRKRVLLEKRKSVHAYVEGYWESNFAIPLNGQSVWYNPYHTDLFRTKESNEACTTAMKVFVTSDGDIKMWH